MRALQHAPPEVLAATGPRTPAAACGADRVISGDDSEAGSVAAGRAPASASSLLRRQPFLAAGFRQCLHDPQRCRRGFASGGGFDAPALGALAAAVETDGRQRSVLRKSPMGTTP